MKFKNDKTKDGWKLEKDCGKVTNKNFIVKKFLKKDEDYVLGETMIKRTDMPDTEPAGQAMAEYLLDHQELLEDYKNYYLVFTGTVWIRPYGDRYVAGLYWDGERWCLDFVYLGGGFHSRCRVVRLASPFDPKTLDPLILEISEITGFCLRSHLPTFLFSLEIIDDLLDSIEKEER